MFELDVLTWGKLAKTADERNVMIDTVLGRRSPTAYDCGDGVEVVFRGVGAENDEGGAYSPLQVCELLEVGVEFPGWANSRARTWVGDFAFPLLGRAAYVARVIVA